MSGCDASIAKDRNGGTIEELRSPKRKSLSALATTAAGTVYFRGAGGEDLESEIGAVLSLDPLLERPILYEKMKE